jgi:hypothetical protein
MRELLLSTTILLYATDLASAATVDVTKYGALCNGMNDDAAPIQMAINQLPSGGGNVVLPGLCAIGQSLILGNGSSSSASTYYGMQLVGEGLPAPASAIFGGFPTQPSSGLRWIGAPGGAMVVVQGPLQRWGLHNLSIDCGGAAEVGVEVISGQFGDNANNTFSRCQFGVYETSLTQFSTGDANSFHNTWLNTIFNVPSGGMAIVLSAGGGLTSDTCYETWINTTINLPGTGEAFGLYLQATDSNMFYNTHIFGGGPDTVAVTFDYSVQNVWPSSNMFFGLDPSGAGSQFINGGTPGSYAAPNIVYGLVTTNGAAPVSIPNLNFR